ncbi:MAG: sigma-70 family RNA polymerase sigma factor [Caulobacteraceae bacterium]|nr:sigma-70 family RNA polymerase sigma factor [Caulobacteraceae bacterium]
MGDGSIGDVSSLFRHWRGGDTVARDRLIDEFYPDLQKTAAALLRYEKGVSFSSGDLVHDTVMRLIQLDRIQLADRAHFLALAAHMMRQVLIDHIRHRRRDKRRHVKVELTTRIEGVQPFDFELVETALRRLAEIDEGHAQVVEMRYFGNMSIGDVAEVLGCSEITVKRRWRAARAWLIDQLGLESRPAHAVPA